MKKPPKGQQEFDFGDLFSPASPAKKVESPAKPVKKSGLPKKPAKTKKKASSKPATELMKSVASQTMNKKSMEKVFTPEELKEIEMRVAAEQQRKAASEAARLEYRRMKNLVKQLEVGNKSKLYVIPSISNGEGFYKLFGFSALYYAYRLAPRMGRNARVMKDSDKFFRIPYVASLVNIEKFKDQFVLFEGSNKIEEWEGGMYVFTLKRELTDDELGELRSIEDMRKEQLHNLIKPKGMDPAIYNAIMMVVRQVAPRVRKLEKQYYYAVGEEMLEDLVSLCACYFDYASGVTGKEEAGKCAMSLVNRLFAALALLSEVRIWERGAAIVIGENINEIRRLTVNKFKL